MRFGGAEGASGDLTLIHNGTNSLISNTTGQLEIIADDIEIRSSTGDEPYVSAVVGAGVSLYFNDVKKVDTTNQGILVQGITTCLLYTSPSPRDS